MILVLGSSRDKVYPRLVCELDQSGYPFVVVDEDHAADFAVTDHDGRWLISGDQCTARRRVGAIFVRHAVARTLDPAVVGPMSALQMTLNRLLLAASCPVVNHPARAYSNYAKLHQLGLLAEAGFDTPRTLLTNEPDAARRFVREHEGRVIFKGASNVMSFAQRWRPEHAERLDLLPHSPTQFQEFIEGVDYRVHVVGDETFTTRLSASNEDYRRSAMQDNEMIDACPAVLPSDVLARCVRFTQDLGLVVSGIDFKEDSTGRLVALELNPYPQFTFYEGRSGQPLTRAVVRYLIDHDVTDTNVFA